MLTFQQGDLFESGCQALVNPVNCMGVMGKGLALVFRRRFPEVYDDYRAAWRASGMCMCRR
jgi:O-acetyl-ADP-ribose deacetylase (regulator of RNase III)